MAEVVTPLWFRSYERQLGLKEHLMRRSLNKIYNIIKTNRRVSIEEIEKNSSQYEGQICEFLGVKPSYVVEALLKHCDEEILRYHLIYLLKLHKTVCRDVLLFLANILLQPVVDGYRNKNSVVFGTDVNGNDKTVGYPIGRQRDRTLVYIEPYHLRNISEYHKSIIRTMKEFIDLSPLTADAMNGTWRFATVRSTRWGETMLWFNINPYKLSEEDLNEAKACLKQFYTSGPGRFAGVTSLYLQVSKYTNARADNSEIFHLAGTEFILEELNGFNFKIGPNSFFQINSSAAEVLYSSIGDLLKEKSTTHLLDVCCGAGIIGILLSGYVEKVYGMDVVAEAIECANENARLNDVTNTEFVCAMAHTALRRMKDENHELMNINNIAAVVNPGRVGLNQRFIHALRRHEGVKQIVYISCKPSGNALRNIVDLLVPENEKIPGQPFKANKALAVDLFPHTRHCELLISLIR